LRQRLSRWWMMQGGAQRPGAAGLGATVRAQDLLRALVQLEPRHANTILDCARRAGTSDLPAFCQLIREEIGGTLLFDAVMMIRSSNQETRSPTSAADLLDHAVRCRAPVCSRKDCLELRSMLASMKAHAQVCRMERCKTCRQWQRVSDRMRRARAASREMATPTGPAAARTPFTVDVVTPQALTPVGGAASPTGSAAGHTLLLLARSALSDLPLTSSPTNSPPCSPRAKRARASPNESAETGGAGWRAAIEAVR